MVHDKNTIIDMAKERARIYERIVGTLMTLPDAEFLKSIKSTEYQVFHEKYSALKQPSVTKGCQLVLNFFKQVEGMDESELLEIMAVDRTRLIRTPFKKAYMPPYEAHYKKKGDTSLLALKQLYQSHGYLPADDIETVDFFAIQLDFLRMLILKMIDNPEKISELITAQIDFLENHPASWIKDYVEKAVPHAETDFYKGWLYIMEGFLELEKGYLHYIQSSAGQLN